jgi:hypothetical protein
MEMMGYATIWTPHDVTRVLENGFHLATLFDDAMWHFETFSMPLMA